jgi:hypothetical protein
MPETAPSVTSRTSSRTIRKRPGMTESGIWISVGQTILACRMKIMPNNTAA